MPRWRLRPSLTMLRLAGPYAAFGVLKRVVSVQALARWAWVAQTSQRAGVPEGVIQAVMTLRRVVGHGTGDCLESALVLYRELSRIGCDPVLVVGVRRHAGQTAGHAWVELGGRVVAESESDIEGFTPLMSFGKDGRPVGQAA